MCHNVHSTGIHFLLLEGYDICTTKFLFSPPTERTVTNFETNILLRNHILTDGAEIKYKFLLLICTIYLSTCVLLLL